MKPFVLGIAGFIGSGKSLAGEFLQSLGAQFVDADEVVDELYRPNNDGWLKIMNYFGRDFLLAGNQINRRKLAKFAFQHPAKLQILNHMIHPLVAHEVMKIIDHCENEVLVVEATYFDKQGLLKYVDEVLWIECDRDILWKRALKRDKIDRKLFDQIMKCQKKPERIDHIITNNNGRDDLTSQVKELWYEIKDKNHH